MIAGTVTDEGIPLVKLEVAGRPCDAIIDTGFNGDVELPAGLRSVVSARLVGRVRSQLASGQQVEEDVYLVDFPFDGRTARVQATFVDGDEILVGTRLLRRHRLEIHFPKRSVLLEREQATGEK